MYIFFLFPFYSFIYASYISMYNIYILIMYMQEKVVYATKTKKRIWIKDILTYLRTGGYIYYLQLCRFLHHKHVLFY